ncbi:MAG: TonB family protein [Prevotella sp.]|nr:TonB family protein [Prevotella sp.]
MLDFLIYDLKVACLIAIFYMFYRLLLAKETLHRLNRVVLLATAALSFVLPLCVLTFHQEVRMVPTADIEIGALTMEVVKEEATQPWWLMPLVVVFLTGAIATIVYSLYSIFQIIFLIKKSEKHPQADGTTIVVTDHDEAPFSWMRYIVLSRSDYASPDAAILAHERGHIRHHHSWDVLFTYIVTPLQWFNPAIWMLRSDLRSIHEYEADKEALSQGINARQYQLLLVTKSLSTMRYWVANGISHSTLKKRITMMLKKQSSEMRGLKVLFVLPVIAISLALNAKTVTTYLPVESSDGVVPAVEETNSVAPVLQEPLTTDDDGDVLYIVDGKQMTDISGIPSDDIKSITYLKGDKARLFGYSRDVIIVELKKKAKELSDVSPDVAAEPVYENCEKMPEFEGGMPALANYMKENVCYPKEAFEANVQGRVLVSFIINENGEVSDASIMQGVEEHLDKEALRVISTMPNWSPGLQDGKPVKVRYTLPVNFRLASTTVKIENNNNAEKNTRIFIRNSDTSSADHSDDTKYTVFIDDVESTKEALEALPPSSIDHISVDKSSDGEKSTGIIKVYTKK